MTRDALTPELRAWRRAQREQLIAARMVMADEVYEAASCAIMEAVQWRLPEDLGLVGAYWPIRREPDCAPLLRTIIEAGGEVALPMMPGPDRPLEFRRWTPATTLVQGRWDIPHPAEGAALQPTVLLIPLVGFDAGGHRLGYGGGFYDRTLAALSPRPLAIGLGFELGRLATTRPQPHDEPMDLIITEAGVVFDRGAA